jgi:hypothetical protein
MKKLIIFLIMSFMLTCNYAEAKKKPSSYAEKVKETKHKKPTKKVKIKRPAELDKDKQK